MAYLSVNIKFDEKSRKFWIEADDLSTGPIWETHAAAEAALERAFYALAQGDFNEEE